jgi:hypothetical protein
VTRTILYAITKITRLYFVVYITLQLIVAETLTESQKQTNLKKVLTLFLIIGNLIYMRYETAKRSASLADFFLSDFERKRFFLKRLTNKKKTTKLLKRTKKRKEP